MCKKSNQSQARNGAKSTDFDANQNVERRGPRHVTLDPTSGLPTPIHCLFCGQAVEERQEEAWVVTPCPHLAFVRQPGTYEHASEDFQQKSLRVEDGALEFKDFPKFLEEAGYGAELLVIELAPTGVQSEKIGLSIAYGFDFSSKTELRPDTESDQTSSVAK